MSSSSLAASSPSPRPSPFSLLPTELIQTIIESTVPHHFHSETYPSRQSTLRSLCLVSKFFRRIARPLLFAVVRVRTNKTLHLWKTHHEEGGGGAGQHCRELLIDLGETQIPDADFSSYLPSSLNTVVLGGSRKMAVDLTKVAKLNSLSTLRLWDVQCKIESNTVFPSLVELGLIHVTWNSPVAEILNPTIFPRLRAFAWSVPKFDSDVSAVLLSFSDQLDMFSADAHHARKWPTALRHRLEAKRLFDYQFDNPEGDDLPSLPFVRLYGLAAEEHDVSLKNLLTDLAVFVELTNEDALPSLLYLPGQLERFYFETGSVDLEGRSFKNECEKKKMEVQFEDQVEDWESDSAISDDFWRRMKKRKLETRKK